MNKLYTLENTFIREVKLSDPVPTNFTGIIKCMFGTTHWYLDGKPHRLDGPASHYFNDRKEWWIYGKQMSEIEHKLYVGLLKLKGLI